MQKFSADGTFLTSFGVEAVGQDEFGGIGGIAVAEENGPDHRCRGQLDCG